jgi:hypothetical protein
MSDGNIKWAVSVFAAAGASLVACILSQPGDMILTETYKPKKTDPAVESVTSETVMSDIPSGTAVANDGVNDVTIPSTIPQSVGNELVDRLAEESTVNEPLSAVSVSSPKWSPPTTSSATDGSGVSSISAIDGHTPSSTRVLTLQERSTPSFLDTVKKLYHEGGVPKFFTGTQARIVHVGLIITSQLIVYDIVKQLLGLPATGSH